MSSTSLPHTGPSDTAPASKKLEIRHLTMADVRQALVLGFEDFRACRTDALTIPIIYPIAGLIMAGALVDQNAWPFIFPVLSGFTLLGPLATLLFAALSRKRERGEETVTAVFNSPRLKTIQRLSGIALLLFISWNVAAAVIYYLTLGTSTEAAGANFFVRVFTTRAGLEMTIFGFAIGAVFAVAVLTLGCVSFPMSLDRDVTTSTAIATSVRAMVHNPVFALVWGSIIVAGLVLGALPGLLGLVVVLPVLGHATWHIYRRIIV